jgi:hypothetical protein
MSDNTVLHVTYFYHGNLSHEITKGTNAVVRYKECMRAKQGLENNNTAVFKRLDNDVRMLWYKLARFQILGTE